MFNGSRLAQFIRHIGFLADQVTIVEVDAELTSYPALPAGVQAPADRVFRTRILEVMVRGFSGWTVEAIHEVDVKTTLTQG